MGLSILSQNYHIPSALIQLNNLLCSEVLVHVAYSQFAQGFFPAPGKTPKPGSHYHTVLVANMHPVSRGSVHIQSADALAKPAVDPAYLSSSIDLDLLVNAVKFTKALHERAPLKDLTVGFVEPKWDDESAKWDSDEAVKEYVKNGFEPVHHPVRCALCCRRFFFIYFSGPGEIWWTN